MNRSKPRITPPARLPAPVSIPVLLDRVLVGSLAALVVARPLVAGDDPCRLRLTSGGGPLSFILCVFLVLIGAIVWRIAFGRGRADWWAVVVPLLLFGVGVAAFVSSQLTDRYARPGIFVAWDWVVLAAVAYLTRRVVPSVGDSRGLLNVLLATAFSVSGLAVYQSLSDRLGLPTTEIVVPADATSLAGDDEFYPELNRPAVSARSPRGTLDSAETLLVFILLLLPAGIAVCRIPAATRWSRWSLVIPLLLGAGAVAALLSWPFRSLPGNWSATIRLIEEHPLLGVGPGNLSRSAPDVLTPHSAWLGLAATAGLVGLGLFVLAVTVSICLSWPNRIPDLVDPPVAGTRWEFYLGGMAGLLLGFVWSTGEMPAEAPAREIFKLASAAILRAILWFASFALLETLRLTPRAMARAILVGVGLVLISGIVSDAAGLPTILFPMSVMLAIAMNLRAAEPMMAIEQKWTRPVLVTSSIAAAALTVAFLVTAALPAWGTASAVRQARMVSRRFAELHRWYETARPGLDRANAVTAARGYLLANIINPLQDAADRDPGNAALRLEVARWRRPLWQYQLFADPQDAVHVADNARKMAETAGQLDPHNLAAKRNLFEAFLLFRTSSTTLPSERIAALNKLIGQIAEREPQSEVPLRYRVVRMLLDRGDSEGVETEATTLLQLNRAEGSPHGRLTDEQEADVIERIKKLPKANPNEPKR